MTSGWGVRILVLVAIATVILAVVVAIFILGPPKRQRQIKLDERRIGDLIELQWEVNSYWKRHKALPPDILTLSREPGFRPPVVDPERGNPYEFETSGVDSFRLCAVFDFDSAEEAQPRSYYSTERWSHGAGRQCFDLKIPRSSRDDNVK